MIVVKPLLEPTTYKPLSFQKKNFYAASIFPNGRTAMVVFSKKLTEICEYNLDEF